MTNKQIHELPAAMLLAPDDQLLVSQAGSNATRRASLGGLPFQPALPGTSRRTIAGKLGEMVSVKDFGAIGDGSVDDSTAFQAALDQHAAIHVPAGTYRLDSEIQIKPRRRLFGADATHRLEGVAMLSLVHPDDRAMEAARLQQSLDLRCDGVCEPMRAKLAPFDEAHNDGSGDAPAPAPEAPIESPPPPPVEPHVATPSHAS